MTVIYLGVSPDDENPLKWALQAAQIDGPVAIFDPGDGTGYKRATVTSGAAQVDHTYPRPGRYNVTVWGGTSSQTLPVDVTEDGPEPAAADVETDPANVPIGVRATLTGMLATHAFIDWGDGTPREVVILRGGAASVAHLYAAGGEYVITTAPLVGGTGEIGVAIEVVVPTPLIASLDPDTAVVGGDDLVMHVHGTGFTAQSVIVFNGGDERTTYVSPTELTTVVKPSTASGPWTVPVKVRNPYAPISNGKDFTFTEPVS